MVLLGNAKLNFQGINQFVYAEFVSVNVLREYNKMKEEIKSSELYITQKQWKTIASVVNNILRKIQVSERLTKID